MHYVALASVLSLAALGAAQNQTVTVQVGSTQDAPGGIFQFIPPSINATNGSVVTFQFSGAPGNHSIAESTFSDPCTLREGGFDSGWLFISPDAEGTPEWNLTITNDSAPIWFYCKQLQPSPHCRAGMVGAINAPTSGDNTFETFQSNARSFSGDVDQGQGNLVGVGASASAGPGPIPSGDTAYAVPGASSTGSQTESGSTPSESAGDEDGVVKTLPFNAVASLIAVALAFTLA